MGGSNISSPQGGYSGFSDHHLNNSDSGYQRSTSSGKLSSPSENNEWNWNDDKINSNNQKSYQNSSGGDNGDDDWNGFDISGNIGGYQSSSYQIDDNKTQIKKNLKLGSSTIKSDSNLDSLDVKTTKLRTGGSSINSKNKLEDDAWNLLNN